MRSTLAAALDRLARWVRPKASPAAGTGTSYAPSGFIDAYRRHREPTPSELLGELKNVAFTCASLNAAACASHPPRLYVATGKSMPEPRCLTGALDRPAEEQLRQHPHLAVFTRKALRVQLVLEHPLLDLLAHVNPVLNAFDLWELTTLYQEAEGNSYWRLQFDAFDTPTAIWPLPSQCVRPVREPGSPRVLDYYTLTGGPEGVERINPGDIIHFSYPNPRDPYGRGLSPLRASYEQVAQMSEFNAFRRSKWDHAGVPGAILTPEEVIGEDEARRYEEQWRQRFQRGGEGDVLVAESKMSLHLLTHSMGDLAALAEYGATKEDVAGAFHVPLSYLTKETNLANLEAAERQHMAMAIRPRLLRRDQKLNERLVPLYDPSGRLFLASEDPVRETREQALKQQELDLRLGIKSINQVRAERGLEPVPWGNVPWLPLNWKPTDKHESTQVIITEQEE